MTTRNGAFASDYPDVFLECRYPAHVWRRKTVRYRQVQRRRLIVVTFPCPCGAEREDVLTATGDRVSSRIRYPKGYVIKGQGRIDRGVWRRETLRRVDIDDTFV